MFNKYIMADKLKIYEYPIDNELDFYINKKHVSYGNTVEDYKLSYITDISVNNNFSRNSQGLCENNSILDEIYQLDKLTDIKKEYSFKSCDPINFKYITKTLNFTKNTKQLEQYSFDADSFQVFYKVAIKKLGLDDNFIAKCILEGLYLPELNFISFYKDLEGNDCRMDGISVENKNFKIPSLNETVLLDTFSRVKAIMEHRVSNCKELVALINKVNNINKNKEIKSISSLLLNEIPKIVYIQKVQLTRESHCCIFGDIHASLQSLLRSLVRLVVTGYIKSDFTFAPDFHIFFLGDLIDRNIYGIDTIFIILNLFLLNPDNVHIIRGNHEEVTTNYRFCFSNEYIKLSDSLYSDTYLQYIQTFSYFPTAVLLIDGRGELMQLCHGGFYRDSNFIKNIKNDITLIDDPEHYLDISWSDFKCGNISDSQLAYANKTKIYGNEVKTRGPIYRANETVEYMKSTNLRFIIRGHQDLVDNTKVILGDKKKCKTNKFYSDMIPMEFVDSISKIKSSSSNSFELNVPAFKDLDKFVATYGFPPMVTLTTGTTSRFVDADGFAILEINKKMMGGNKKYYAKYMAIKKLYLQTKKN